MLYVRKSQDRGIADFGWLKSHHSFSFGHYFDPKHMGISTLRVINDDTVSPGAGFDTHGHRDMEIISYVIYGALEHKDSTGNRYVVPAGEVQRMSAGRGIMHSEFNASKSEPVRFLQIWITPDTKGIEPGYEQKRIEQNGPLTPLATPDGKAGSLLLHQDAGLYRLQLKGGQSYSLDTAGRIGYLHLIKGQLSAESAVFDQGDAFALAPESKVLVSAEQDLEALWFDLPPQA